MQSSVIDLAINSLFLTNLLLFWQVALNKTLKISILRY